MHTCEDAYQIVCEECPGGRVVKDSDFGSRYPGFQSHWRWKSVHNCMAFISTVLHHHPSIVLMRKKKCWKGCKTPNHSHHQFWDHIRIIVKRLITNRIIEFPLTSDQRNIPWILFKIVFVFEKKKEWKKKDNSILESRISLWDEPSHSIVWWEPSPSS